MGDKRSIKTNENLAWHLLLGVGPRPELLMNVNFEPIIRGLQSDIFEV